MITDQNFGTYDEQGQIHYERMVWIKKYLGQREEVVIPAEIEGLPVRVIMVGAFAAHPALKKITIPGSVMIIQPNAFGLDSQLKKLVILPSTNPTLSIAMNSLRNNSPNPPHLTVELPDKTREYVFYCETFATGYFDEGEDKIIYLVDHVTIRCPKGSLAQQRALELGIPCETF